MAIEEPRIDQSEPRPPVWATSLLPWLVRSDRAESIDGDLLEEYVDRVGRHGRRGAGAWYTRQVAGFLWGLSWPFGLLVALQVVTRTIADTVVPPDNYQLRSTMSTWGAIYAYLFAGAHAAWRTRRTSGDAIVSGAIVALAAHAIGSTISIAASIVFYLTVISRDPAMVRLFQMTGGWGEFWGIPVVTTPIVIALGAAGGFAGKLIGAAARGSALSTKHFREAHAER